MQEGEEIMTTQQTVNALQQICNGVIEVCASDQPIPGGTIYAALMTQGCTITQYEQLMAALVHAGMIEQKGLCYIATAAGRQRIAG